MKPVLDELHQRMGDKVRIIKIDIDQSPAAANAYQVQSVPTLLLFQNGEILWRQSGVMPAVQLEKIIQTTYNQRINMSEKKVSRGYANFNINLSLPQMS